MNKSLWQKIQPHAIAIGIFFVISCLYCLPALQGLVVSQHDAVGWKGMAQQSFDFYEKHGRYPLWTNSTFSGMPAFQILVGATYNVHIAYLHHLFMLFLPEPAGLFFLACLGFYILCLSLGIRNWIAVLGSLAYAFASYNAIIVSVGHTTKFSSMGYAPAVLAGIILLTQRRYLLGFITTLVFSTQLFYQNHVQIVYYTLLMALCLVVAYAIRAIREKAFAHLAKTAGLALIAGVMGMLSYAVILFPTYDYTKETMRGGRSELTSPQHASNKSKGGLDKDYAFGYSYGITEVLTMIVPRMYGGSSGELPENAKTAEVFAAHTGMSEDQANDYVKQFPAYWGPQGGTSGAVYFGAIICALFIFGIVFYTGWHKQWILAATILGILLAWGKHFPSFNYFLFDYLPFYNKFRAPSMAMVIPQLGFPLLAALGLNQFLEQPLEKHVLWKKFKLALTITGAVAALLVALYFTLDYKSDMDSAIRENLTNGMLQQLSKQGEPTPQMQQQATEFGRSVVNALKQDRRSLYGSDLFRSLLFIVLGIGLLFLYVKNQVKKPVVVFGLMALTLIDLLGVDLRYLSSRNYVDKEGFEEAFVPTAADLQILKDTSYYRVFNHSDGDPFQLSGATPRTSYFHNSVGGYHPAKLALYNDLIARQLTKGNIAVFNMLNTKYFIISNPSNNQPMVEQNPDALGAAWFVAGIKYVNNADEEMNALDDLNPRDTAVAEKKEQSKIPFLPQRDSTASIKLIQNENDLISYKSISSSDQFAVFSEIYYPNGWKAFIDGKETPIVKVNYLLRGLPVTKGEHTIEFRFEPESYILGNRISFAIGLLSILILAYGLFALWKNYRDTGKAIAINTQTNDSAAAKK
ncbi:MAG: YfhO family protein [Chitinophagaceae bacterium]|nr:YfhO family protein [Chitinophagaceae bacterium]